MADNVQSVLRAFDILRVLAAHSEVQLRDLAAETGLPKSTLSRLLATMESIGIVGRGVSEGSYTSGPALPAITGSAQRPSQLLGVAHAYLAELTDRYGEDSALAVADGEAVIYTVQVQSDNPIQVPNWTRQRFQPHTVAAGFVLMAWWPAERLDAYLETPLDAPSPKTMTDPDAIRRRSADIRRRGYAWAFDEWLEGISAVAAPVLDSSDNLVAMVSTFGPSYRFPGDRDPDQIGRDLAETGRLLSRHL
jgi:DNA-binding IclR family transcriptional regulator